MKFPGVKNAISVCTDEITSRLLHGLFKVKVLSYDEAGWWTERLGNRFRLEGLTIHMDNPLILTYFKGTLVGDLYEKDERQVTLKYLSLDEPVIELGGSIGVVSCLINRKLVSPSKHVVVEANPLLIPTLRKNRDANGCQFGIVEAALGYGGDTIEFFTHGLSLVGSIYADNGQKMEVPARTLQSIAIEAGFYHFTLVSDIEGSEIDLVVHEMDFIREHVGLILMELHEETPLEEKGVKVVLDTLKAHGFEVVDNIRHNYCFRNTKSLEAKEA